MIDDHPVHILYTTLLYTLVDTSAAVEAYVITLYIRTGTVVAADGGGGGGVKNQPSGNSTSARGVETDMRAGGFEPRG